MTVNFHPIFLLTCSNFLISFCLSHLTVMRILAGKLEKKESENLLVSCLSFEEIEQTDLHASSPRLCQAAWTCFSQRAHPHRLLGSRLWAYVSEAGEVGRGQTWIGMSFELIRLTWPLPIAQSLLNWKFLGMERKRIHFWPSDKILQIVCNYSDTKDN